MERLAADLTKRFGRGFSRQNLQQMRQFYQTYPPDAIRQTASGELNIPATPQVGTASADGPLAIIQQLARRFPLPWSHYRALHFLKMPSLVKSFPTWEAFRRIASAIFVAPVARRKPMAALRRAAMIWGPPPLRMRLASSPNVTSRT